MIRLRPAGERGHANHGWLDTYHTFSFNTYFDRAHMGFRSLRVINEDRVQPGKGFGRHPHNDMEIITYVLEGALEHQDSMGNGSVIKPGDVQRMSAGTGVLHSEANPSQEKEVHLLQIWIIPDEEGVKPSYEQKTFTINEKAGKLCLVASPNGARKSVTIHADARVYSTVLAKDQTLPVPVEDGRHLWIHVARGSVQLNGRAMSAGDGAAVSEEKKVTLTGVDNAEVLIFDLA
jgi:quercetin 2,3-dioxygenase